MLGAACGKAKLAIPSKRWLEGGVGGLVGISWGYGGVYNGNVYRIHWDHPYYPNFSSVYHLVMTNIAMENHHFLIGKPSINGPFSMAMLNNQRVNKWRHLFFLIQWCFNQGPPMFCCRRLPTALSTFGRFPSFWRTFRIRRDRSWVYITYPEPKFSMPSFWATYLLSHVKDTKIGAFYLASSHCIVWAWIAGHGGQSHPRLFRPLAGHDQIKLDTWRWMTFLTVS